MLDDFEDSLFRFSKFEINTSTNNVVYNEALPINGGKIF